MAEKTEAQVVRDIERAVSPIHTVGNKQQIAIIPDGYTIADLEEYLETPVRQRANRVFHDVESFVAYCNHFQKDGFTNGNSRLFADRNKTTFFAIFDYAGWKEHTAKYTCPLSDEWKIWIGKNASPMTQQQFAEFIENNLPDIRRPDSAEMLEISRTLEAKKNVNFLSTTRLRDGTVDFTYEEKVETTANKGMLVVPEMFEIFIPVFVGGGSEFIKAKLRYRIGDGGKLAMWYELERPHKVLDEAFKDVRETIEQNLTVKALMGEI